MSDRELHSSSPSIPLFWPGLLLLADAVIAATLNKYAADLPDALILAMWVVPLLAGVVWLVRQRKELKNSSRLTTIISLFVLLLLGILAFSILDVYRHKDENASSVMFRHIEIAGGYPDTGFQEASMPVFESLFENHTMFAADNVQVEGELKIGSAVEEQDFKRLDRPFAGASFDVMPFGTFQVPQQTPVPFSRDLIRAIELNQKTISLFGKYRFSDRQGKDHVGYWCSYFLFASGGAREIEAAICPVRVPART